MQPTNLADFPTMTTPHDASALHGLVMPLSREERREWRDGATLPHDATPFDDASLYDYANTSERITLSVPLAQMPIYASELRLQLTLSQLREWLRKHGVELQWWDYALEDK